MHQKCESEDFFLGASMRDEDAVLDAIAHDLGTLTAHEKLLPRGKAKTKTETQSGYCRWHHRPRKGTECV